MKTRVFSGNNPSLMYLQSFNELMVNGDECAPRGKRIKELRPVVFEFENPCNRVTFLRGRKINPFFQLAEALWIVSGHSDVEFLDAFNKNMRTFSDDGKYFNASYGERIRYFTKNDLHGIILNPVDQLQDAYFKLKDDHDTRQAVIVISNPLFDNFRYTKGEQGKDIACNLTITFKIRDNKLDMTVFNRSNDIIYGLFGANLCQFSSIQELMASWLEVEVGTYTHITDSLHTYLDSYGAGENEAILDSHPEIGNVVLDDFSNYEESVDFVFDSEPRMNMSYEKFDAFLSFFWNGIVGNIFNDSVVSESYEQLCSTLHSDKFNEATDSYWLLTIDAMIAYRLVRLGNYKGCLEIIKKFIPDSRWKVSMIYFMKSLIHTKNKYEDSSMYEDCVNIYNSIVEDLKNSVKSDSEVLGKYLSV
jgi:thymidylate synthase